MNRPSPRSSLFSGTTSAGASCGFTWLQTLLGSPGFHVSVTSIKTSGKHPSRTQKLYITVSSPCAPWHHGTMRMKSMKSVHRTWQQEVVTLCWFKLCNCAARCLPTPCKTGAMKDDLHANTPVILVHGFTGR